MAAPTSGSAAQGLSDGGDSEEMKADVPWYQESADQYNQDGEVALGRICELGMASSGNRLPELRPASQNEPTTMWTVGRNDFDRLWNELPISGSAAPMI